MNIRSFSAKKRFAVILTLGLLSAIGPLSIDMYLPAFDTISADFSTSVEKVQLSLTSFFIGIAIGQLIYGPLLDKFGRKKPIIIGLGVYILMSLLCAYTTDVNHLIVYRFLQALGSCSGMVAGRAIVRDLFEPRESAKVFSMLMLVIGVSPIVAPSVGAFVLINFDWHIIFILLALVALLILLCVVFLLPESYAGDRNMSMKPRVVFGNFAKVFTQPAFILYALVGSFASSGLYAYLAGSSFALQNVYQLNEQQYGLAFATVAGSVVLATQLNRILLNKWSSEVISKNASRIHATVGLLFVSLVIFAWVDLYTLLVLTCLFMGAQGFIFPNTSAMALAPFGKLAGSASAMLGCLQMSLGAISSGLVSYFHNGTIIPMVGVMCFGAVSAFLLYTFLPNVVGEVDKVDKVNNVREG